MGGPVGGWSVLGLVLGLLLVLFLHAVSSSLLTTAERPSPKVAEIGEMLGGRTGGMPPRATAGRAWGLGGEQSIGGGWGLACTARDVRAVRQG